MPSGVTYRDSPEVVSRHAMYARMSLGASKIDPDFPARPDANQIDAEYTPERVTRLAMFIAGKRATDGNPEQYDEDVSECIALIYDRIAKYKRGAVNVHPNYPFYYWLLFDVRTALRDLRDRGKGVFVHFSTLQEDGKPDFQGTDDETARDRQLDVREAVNKLPEGQRQVLQMYYLDHKTQAQIATALKISQPAVAQKLERAKANLERLLSEAPEDDDPSPARPSDYAGPRGKVMARHSA